MSKLENNYINDLLKKDEKVMPKLVEMLSAGSERALLSLMLNSSKNFLKIRYSIDPKDFTSKIHKRLYEIVCQISDDVNNGNYVTPEQVLYVDSFQEEFRKYNIKEYIEALRVVPYNNDSLDGILKVVKSKRVQRELWHDTCERLQMMLEFEGSNVEELINIAEPDIYNIMRDHGTVEDDIYKFGTNTMTRLKERESRPSDILGLRFSLYPEFTKIINGACKRELIIGAARMKEGKSAFLNGLATNLSIWGDEERYTGKNVIPVGYIDSEMEEDMQEDRSLANISGVEQRKITNGLYIVNEDDQKKVYEAEKWLQNGELYWKRIREFSTRSVIYTAKRMIKEYGTQLICFDQIKDTIDTGVNLSTTKQRVAWLASALKFLSEDMDVSVIAMMQLSRGGTMEQLRQEWIDPSTAFADADEPLRFANKGFYLCSQTKQEIDQRGGVGVVGDKVINLFINRNGDIHDRTGGIGYNFRKRNTRFEEMRNLE